MIKTQLTVGMIKKVIIFFYSTGVHLESSQTSKMEQPLTISTKDLIMDVPLSSECPSIQTYVLILQLYCSEHWKDLVPRMNCLMHFLQPGVLNWTRLILAQVAYILDEILKIKQKMYASSIEFESEI